MDFGKKQENGELIKLIKDSFLAQAVKQELLDLYAREGASVDFAKKFEAALVSGLRQRTETAIGLDKQIEVEFARIINDFAKKKADLTVQLQKDLAIITTEDVTAKTALWDAYYAKVDEAQKAVADAIQKFSQKVLIDSVK